MPITINKPLSALCCGLLLAGCSTTPTSPWQFDAEAAGRRIIESEIAYQRAQEASAHGPTFQVPTQVAAADTDPSWHHDVATAGMTAGATVGGLKLAESISSSGAAQVGRAAAAEPVAAAAEEKIAGRLVMREAAVSAAEVAAGAEAVEALEGADLLLLFLLF